MKKLFKLFAFAAIFGALSVSCSKEAAAPDEEVAPGADGTEVTAPADDENLPEGMIRLNFSVSAENEADPELKTSWDGNTHSWADGDEIRILWGTGDNDYVDAEVESGGVSAVVPETAETFYAVYPTTGAFALREGGTIDFGIPILQSGSFEDANMMAAKTSKEAASLKFKNLTHIFKFHLTDDSPYDRFQICTNNGTIVVNTYGVSFDSEGAVTIGTRSEEISGYVNSKYVRLHSGMTPGGDYYFAVVPGANYSLGFGVQARINGNSGEYSVAALSKGAIDTSNPRAITDLGNLDTFVHSDWFITSNGTGKGTSWDNPGGPALLRSLLVIPSTFTTDQSKKNHTFRLNNAVIHLKEGTYNFQTILADSGVQQFGATAFSDAVDNVTVIDGGYPSSASGKDLSGYDPVNHPSVIISNQAAANDRTFYFNGARLYDWTFKGLSFQNNPNATNYNTPGGAVAVNGATNGTIKFEDCSFSLTTSNSSGGGALSFRGTAEVNAVFKNCTFSSCSATAGFGGGIWINTEKHNLTFDGCTISGNTANKGGGFIYNQNSGAVVFKNCTLENNAATNSTGLGGAIYASGAGTIELFNTSVSGNGTDVQAQHGGAVWMGGTIEVKMHRGCTVSNNKVSSRGGVVLVAETAKFRADTVVFSGNYGANGGVIHVNGGTAWVNSCEFSGNSATNGAALRAAGSADSQANLIATGCLFDANIPSGSSNGGGCINATTYSRSIIANSTITNTSGGNGAAFSIAEGAAGTWGYIYALSCTFSGNTVVFGRNYNYCYFYNCIADCNVTTGNPGKTYSILGDNRYSTNKTVVETEAGLGAACLGTFSNGVYPLNSTKAASYGAGMSAADLQALTFDNITLTDDQKALLAKDQKGNDRDGNIMGAYVLNTAPTE